MVAVQDGFDNHRERRLLRMNFRWGAVSDFRCKSCPRSNLDARNRRSLQINVDGRDHRSLQMNDLELYMSRELTKAIRLEVQAATATFTEFGCFGNGSSLMVVFDLI